MQSLSSTLWKTSCSTKKTLCPTWKKVHRKCVVKKSIERKLQKQKYFLFYLYRLIFSFFHIMTPACMQQEPVCMDSQSAWWWSLLFSALIHSLTTKPPSMFFLCWFGSCSHLLLLVSKFCCCCFFPIVLNFLLVIFISLVPNRTEQQTIAMLRYAIQTQFLCLPSKRNFSLICGRGVVYSFEANNMCGTDSLEIEFLFYSISFHSWFVLFIVFFTRGSDVGFWWGFLGCF